MLINKCKCGSFALVSLTIPGFKSKVHCYNENWAQLGHDCEEAGPECDTSDEAARRWNAGEREPVQVSVRPQSVDGPNNGTP